MALSELTESILEDIPSYYAPSDVATMVLDAMVREITRVEETTEEVFAEFWGQNATETYGLLAAHERILGIPQNPAATSVAQRQDAIVAAVRRRYSSKGTTWRDSVTRVLGVSTWSVTPHRPNDYDLTITVPFEEGSDQFDSVEALIRPFTPSHLNIVVTAGEGFIVGVSLVGEGVL